MIKSWSEETRLIVYEHMNNIWKERAIPLWMKDKVVRLVPKVAGSSDLKNMRPISLYEVIRKVWTTINVKHIHLVWHENDVLHPSQYGYRLDKGTQMPLLNILNKIEAAVHDSTTTQISFWDVKRAFDSIPRTLQMVAWIRLGVPEDVAEWFVPMDDGGLSFLATPHYFKERDLHSAEEMTETDNHFSNNNNYDLFVFLLYLVYFYEPIVTS